MNDESLSHRVEEWMEEMAITVPPEDLTKIAGNETALALFTTLIDRSRPEKAVRIAKCISLYQKLLLPLGQNRNCKENSVNLQLVKRRNKLREQLKLKEVEFAEKQKKYMMIVKEIEQLLREIQQRDNVLNEENKKLAFLLVHKQALHNTLKEWKSLRLSVSEVKDIQKGAREKLTTRESDAELMEVIRSCQTDLQKEVEEERIDLQNTADESDGANSSSTERKYEVVNHITAKLKGFPWCSVFDGLLTQQRQLITNIQSMLNIDDFGNERPSPRTAENFSKTLLAEITQQQIKISCCKSKLRSENENLMKTPENNLSDLCSRMKEELNTLENHLQNIDYNIQEKANECKNIKVQLRNHLAQVSRLIWEIKQFPRCFQTSRKENSKSFPYFEELYTSIRQLCADGSREIDLFANTPLAALEKLTLTGGKCVPVYELISSYHKALCNVSKLSNSSVSMVNDASSLVPHNLLISVWKQLTYLGAFHKIKCFTKPFVGMNAKVQPSVGSEVHKNMESISKTCVESLIALESNLDEAWSLSSVINSHSLNEAVPKNLLVDGVSIDYFKDLYNILPKNENSECNIVLGDSVEIQ